MDISQIISTLQTLSDEVAKLEQKPIQATPYDEVKELVKIANTYPFSNHILTEKSESIRMNYIATLLALIEDTADETVRTQQLLYIYRIIASYDPNINIRDYIIKSLKTDNDFWDDLIELFDYETSFIFAVDMLALGMLDTSDSNKNLYESLSSILQAFKFDKKTIKKIALVSKSIIEQNFSALIEKTSKDDNINHGSLLGYYSSIDYQNITSDFFGAAKLNGKLLIANAKIKNHTTIIELDKFAADEICFYNCEFDFIRGIKSNSKKVKFEKCSFDKNDFDKNRAKKEEQSYPFIQGGKMQFENCTFTNCNSNYAILDLKDSKIIDCEFENCNGSGLIRQYFFLLTSCDVALCTFKNCNADTDSPSRSNTIGGFIFIKNGKMNKCTFNRCYANGHSGYGKYSHYHMQIVRAINTNINNCEFISCGCYGVDGWQKCAENYILALTNSPEKNNKFDKDCSAYHYNYDERRSSYNIGIIEES